MLQLQRYWVERVSDPWVGYHQSHQDISTDRRTSMDQMLWIFVYLCVELRCAVEIRVWTFSQHRFLRTTENIPCCALGYSGNLIIFITRLFTYLTKVVPISRARGDPKVHS